MRRNNGGERYRYMPLLYRPMSMEMNTYTLQISAFSLVNLSRAET